MDYIAGYVSNADDTDCFKCQYIPVYRRSQVPMFEAVLGYGFTDTSIGHATDQCGVSESSFYICWKLREDKRVNEVLLQLYPDTKFAIDVAVMRLGQDGQMVPLRGYPNILQAFYAIKRYVHNHDFSEVPIQ